MFDIKLYISILTNHFNWFYFEQYVYNNGGIHVPLQVEEYSTLISKIKLINESNIVYVDSELLEKWLIKKKIKVVNIVKEEIINKCLVLPKYYSYPKENENAVILFTSGSQNTYKAVLLNHHSQNSSFTEFSKSIIFNDCKSYLDLLGHTFSGGRKVFYSALIAGKKIFLSNKKISIINNLQVNKPDLIACVPFMLYEILTFIKLNGNQFALKKIICGGAYLDEKIIFEFEKYGILVYNVYGLTESTSLCSYPTSDNYILGSAGKISDNIEFKLSEKSELLIKGPVVGVGYFENGAVKEFIDKSGYFNTRDIVEIDKEKNLFVKGRTTNFVKTNKGGLINLEDVIGFKFFQSQNINLHCLTLENKYDLAVSNNASLMDLEQLKSKLSLLRSFGIYFNKILIYKNTNTYELKANKDKILNNIVKEIKVQ